MYVKSTTYCVLFEVENIVNRHDAMRTITVTRKELVVTRVTFIVTNSREVVTMNVPGSYVANYASILTNG